MIQMLSGRARHSRPRTAHAPCNNVGVLNLGSCLFNGDLAIQSQVHVLADAVHRFVLARTATIQLRSAGVSSGLPLVAMLSYDTCCCPPLPHLLSSSSLGLGGPCGLSCLLVLPLCCWSMVVKEPRMTQRSQLSQTIC